MLPSFISPEKGPSPELQQAINYRRLKYYAVVENTQWSLLHENPSLFQSSMPMPEASPAPVMHPESAAPVAGTAIAQTARYAHYEQTAEERHLAEIRRQVAAESRSARGGNHDITA